MMADPRTREEELEHRIHDLEDALVGARDFLNEVLGEDDEEVPVDDQ